MMERELLKVDLNPVIAHYGATDNIMATGFILYDGTMLDFGKHYFTFQAEEHNTIEEITGYNKDELLQGTDIVKVEHGAGNILGIYSYDTPTKEQLKQVFDAVIFHLFELASIDIGTYKDHSFCRIRVEQGTDAEETLDKIRAFYKLPYLK